MTPDCCPSLRHCSVPLVSGLTKKPSRMGKANYGIWGPLPPATAALLTQAPLYPSAPEAKFIPQNLSVAVVQRTLVFPPSFLSFRHSCPNARKRSSTLRILHVPERCLFSHPKSKPSLPGSPLLLSVSRSDLAVLCFLGT